MRFSLFIRRLSLALIGLILAGCAGVQGSNGQAFAKSSKAQALAALDRPNLIPKNLFGQDPPKRHIRTLAVAGDSLSIGLASEMEKALADKPGLGFTSLGKVSSGLARPDFFDWNRNMDDLASRYKPDAVVMMIGANDNKPLRLSDGSQINYGTREWDLGYKERVRRIVSIIRTHNPSAVVFWLEAPVMADPGLSHDLKHINALAREVMTQTPDCHFVETRTLFCAPGGGFAFSKPDVEDGATLRTRDGIHLTTAGAQALAGHCLTALQTRLTWEDPRPADIPLADKGV
jgi:hypothetical protein